MFSSVETAEKHERWSNSPNNNEKDKDNNNKCAFFR